MAPECLAGVWAQMKTGCSGGKGLDAALADAASFNAGNKYRKRGVYCIPVSYDLDVKTPVLEKCFVSVQSDGSIAVRSSGLEVGQGINTKVAQAVALGLLPALPSSSSSSSSDDPAMRLLGRVVVDGSKSTKLVVSGRDQHL